MKLPNNTLSGNIQLEPMHSSATITARAAWKQLYHAAAYASLVMVLFIPVQIVVYFIWPPPQTVTGWFGLFESNPIVGLLDMDLLLGIDYLLMAVVFLALYVALRKHEPSLMTIALAVQLLAISIYFASTTAFEMLSLSKLFSAAGTEAERNQLIAAGQAMMVTWQGTAFNVSYILGGFALLITSIIMYSTEVFPRSLAILGLIMGVLMLVPPTVGTVGVIISLVSLVPLVPWLLLLARRFFHLKDETNTTIVA